MIGFALVVSRFVLKAGPSVAQDDRSEGFSRR
jgi:hypothetical protein